MSWSEAFTSETAGEEFPGLEHTMPDGVGGIAAVGGNPDLVLPHLLGGVVVEGDHRGRELGYPTANVAVAAVVDAPEGVFAGTVQRADGSIFRSAISVGRRETFYAGEAPVLVEAYLLDFSGDLYGEHLRVELVRALRPQERFSGVDALVRQIESDVAKVHALIGPGHLETGREVHDRRARQDGAAGASRCQLSLMGDRRRAAPRR